ncbi:MAG: hypothetical protein RLZZ450_3103, partial [Pseudomonadota bacterium]
MSTIKARAAEPPQRTLWPQRVEELINRAALRKPPTVGMRAAGRAPFNRVLYYKIKCSKWSLF